MNSSLRNVLWVVSAGLLVAGAVGCGTKGPLVLPAKPPTAVADATAGVPAQPAVVDPADLEAGVDAGSDADTDVDADVDADVTLDDEPAAAKPGV